MTPPDDFADLPTLVFPSWTSSVSPASTRARPLTLTPPSRREDTAMTMTSVRRRPASYDPVSKAFHWTTLGLVVALYTLVMVPGIVDGSRALHKSLGMLLLAVVICRLGWRLLHPKPGHARQGKWTAEQIVARLVHAAFYGLLIAVPLLGWAYLGYAGKELEVFGVNIPPVSDFGDPDIAEVLLLLKAILAWGMLALIGLHAAAALFHHYVRRDDVLRSMLPSLPSRAGRSGAEAVGEFGHARTSQGHSAAD